jgi:hypothetical protein
MDGRAAAAYGAPRLFHYVNGAGRDVYTDRLSAVAAPYRPKVGAVDLSHVSLNEQLGRDLRQHLRREHQRLAATPLCEATRARAGQGWLRRLWSGQSPYVLWGAAAALLVLVAPRLLRDVDPTQLGKTLTMAIPALAAVGLFAAAVMKAEATHTRVRTVARLCSPHLVGSSDVRAELQGRQRAIDQLRALDDEALRNPDAVYATYGLNHTRGAPGSSR